ncbi:S-methyl-5'-thioadenosine phosphorylase-like [Zophobas morio]|uniref:S-methyl-5'-thioadenosine phosphorylase-like n=1 Tax=Zophobas morio TaxID=2755281 RepID=UPI0030838506
MAIAFKVGIIGGTGLDDPKFFNRHKEKKVSTPYGEPSDVLEVGTIAGVDCVLLSRHGRSHSIQPTNINFRANIWALKEEGCTHILASTACGSLRQEIEPGHFVFIDQAIDRTTKRVQTFYDGVVGHPPGICHLPLANPFNEKLRDALKESAARLGIPHHTGGTVITIEGPRFSTRAESLMYRSWGGDVINMTTFPEVVLANEAGLLYASVALATDYDCWRSEGEHVSVELVLETLRKNSENCKRLILDVIPRLAAIDWSHDIKCAKYTCNSSVMLPFIKE